MKRKGMQVLGLGLSVLCAACGLREASESQATSAPTAPPVSAVVSNPVTSPPEKEALVLFPDLANAQPDRGEVILTVPWGDAEGEIALWEIPDMPGNYVGPSGFTVSDQGEILVCDSGAIRIFKDNKQISVLQFPMENPEQYNLPFIPVSDLTIINGTMYLADMYTNRILAVIDGKAVPLDLGAWGRWGKIERLGKTPSGKLLINDNRFALSAENKTEARQIPPDNQDSQIFEYDEGHIVRVTFQAEYTGDVETNRYFIYSKETTDGKELASVIFNVYSHDLYSTDGKNIERRLDAMPLGADRQGRMYIDARVHSYIENVEIQTERFLIRLDIDRQELSVQQVNDVRDPHVLSYIYSNPEVDADGNVYLAFASLKDGMKIVKYSFDK